MNALTQLLIGEPLVWLLALVVWLWPAHVRHRIVWAVWDWLHPLPTPCAVGIPTTESPMPSNKEWLVEGFIQNALYDPAYAQGMQDAAAQQMQNLSAYQQNIAGLGQANFNGTPYATTSIFGNLFG